MTELAAVIGSYGDQLEAAAQGVGGHIQLDAAGVLRRDAALGLRPPGMWSPNGHCRLVQAADGWIAVNLARDDDRNTVPAWLGCTVDDDVWPEVIARVRDAHVADLLAQAQLLQLPVAAVGETRPVLPQIVPKGTARGGLRVADLSTLWAGPLCGGLLAAAGAAVTRFDSVTRPDPTARNAPELDAWLNRSKVRQSLDVNDAQALQKVAAATDVLITSARPHALARLGLIPDRLFRTNPGLVWVAITAHGWYGPGALRVGFGDDCAAAGGLVAWDNATPRFIGDALADPLTGIAAAIAALDAVAAGHGGLIDCSLAGVAADAACRMAG